MEFTHTVSSHENENQEIVPIEQARFFDTIAPEYEELWRKIHGAAKATHEVCEEVLLPVFADTTLPQIIRDRVGLVAVGAWTPSYPYEREGWTRGFGYLFQGACPESFKKLAPGMTAQGLTEWICAIADYEQTTTKKIVHPATALSWIEGFDKYTEPDPAALQLITDWTIRAAHAPADFTQDEKQRGDYLISLFNLSCRLYNEERIDEETLDDIINHIPQKNLRLNLKNEEQNDSGWFSGDGTAPVKRPGAFTIITEGLSGRTTFEANSRFTAWCKKKLRNWTNAQSDDSIKLPDWLAAIDVAMSTEIFASQVSARDSKYFVGWDIIEDAYTLLGSDIFTRFSHRDNDQLKLIQQLPAEPLARLVLKDILQQRAHEREHEEKPYPFLKENITSLEIMASSTNDPVVISLVGIEKALQIKKDDDLEARRAARQKKREEEERRNPKNIQKQEARADLTATIEDLRIFYAKVR